jgi:amphi-Trp domain-containing protein
LLRDLAQEREAKGKVEAAFGTWAIAVNPMPPIKLEVQYKKAKKKLEIQIYITQGNTLRLKLTSAGEFSRDSSGPFNKWLR